MTVFGLIQSIFEIFEKLVAPVESFDRLGLSLERFWVADYCIAE